MIKVEERKHYEVPQMKVIQLRKTTLLVGSDSASGGNPGGSGLPDDD